MARDEAKMKKEKAHAMKQKKADDEGEEDDDRQQGARSSKRQKKETETNKKGVKKAKVEKAEKKASAKKDAESAESSNKITFVWFVKNYKDGEDSDDDDDYEDERLLLLPECRYKFWKRAEKIGECKTWGEVRALGTDVYDYARSCLECNFVPLKDNPSDDEVFPADTLWMYESTPVDEALSDYDAFYPPTIEKMMNEDLLNLLGGCPRQDESPSEWWNPHADWMEDIDDSAGRYGLTDFHPADKDEILKKITNSGDLVKEEPGLGEFNSVYNFAEKLYNPFTVTIM
eukprot:CAMPEP_0178644548 /NCGR_PEP_ID=MMETSP0698-20121128/18344_1 /TAXON_ID=265572 /ORGANISM="Extubocellulus spinifer, Strain CCMP396" /LENGTH=286 /DNA_ID=CAMNT_0020285533 /DNA_START=25 /DNA_END=885 /DNA_ORIENTATION=-